MVAFTKDSLWASSKTAPLQLPRRCPQRPLTEQRLTVCVRLLVRGRADALSLADPWAGDDAWSIGCRAYSFSRNQLRRASETGRYNWLGILDETHHFVFLIEGVPVRFFHGDAGEPNKRALRQQENEAHQLALAPGGSEHPDGLMFRLALKTDQAGAVQRVVLLGLHGEEGHVKSFWPVPMPQKECRSSARQGQLGAASFAPK